MKKNSKIPYFLYWRFDFHFVYESISQNVKKKIVCDILKMNQYPDNVHQEILNTKKSTY